LKYDSLISKLCSDATSDVEWQHSLRSTLRRASSALLRDTLADESDMVYSDDVLSMTARRWRHTDGGDQVCFSFLLIFCVKSVVVVVVSIHTACMMCSRCEVVRHVSTSWQKHYAPTTTTTTMVVASGVQY
jgi:hypothetical protein